MDITENKQKIASVQYVDNAYMDIKSNVLQGYLPVEGGQMTNTNLVKNLNADLLDGYDVGLNNGQIPILVDFPSYNKLVELGYNTEELKTNTEAYFKGLCKWCNDTYKSSKAQILIGNVAPNSQGLCIIHLYGYNDEDEEGNVKYCTGFHLLLSNAGQFISFGFINFVWSFNILNTSNINANIAKIPTKANISDVYTKAQIDDKNFATKSEVDTRIQGILNGAPADYDTLKEIADKLQDGDGIHTALIQSISEKASKSEFDVVKNKVSNYCFNGIITRQNLDNAKKQGYYLVTENSTGFTNLSSICIVYDATGSNGITDIRQMYYRYNTETKEFTPLYRRFYNEEWSNWEVFKINGSNIVDNTITNSKIADATITNAKLAGASVTPAANKIPIADENGMLQTKGIKLNQNTSEVKAVGWYRVCRFGNKNSVSANVILNINRNYSYNNESYSFSINRCYSNKVNITQISGLFNDKSIKKIRVLTNNANYSYIDIYYDNSSATNIYVSGIGDYALFQTPILSNDIPEGYTATEFETTNGFKPTTANFYPVIARDYTNGVLITTDIENITGSYDKFIEVEIKGNTYGTVSDVTVINTKLQLCISNNTSNIANGDFKVVHYGQNLGDVYCFVNSDNKICFWFKQGSRYWSPTITVKNLYTGTTNKKGIYWGFTVENKALPTEGITNLVTGIVKQVVFEDGNIASANKLTTKQLTNEDLNNIKDDNFATYYANPNNTCANKPSDVDSFGLQVLRITTSFRVQILTTSECIIYKRRWNSASWSPWKRMLTEDDLSPIIARIEALEAK